MSNAPITAKITDEYVQYLDKGPWEAVLTDNGVVNIYSDDFTHDVTLKVSGDFADTEDKLNYAKAIAEALNNEAARAKLMSFLRETLGEKVVING